PSSSPSIYERIKAVEDWIVHVEANHPPWAAFYFDQPYREQHLNQALQQPPPKTVIARDRNGSLLTSIISHATDSKPGRAGAASGGGFATPSNGEGGPKAGEDPPTTSEGIGSSLILFFTRCLVFADPACTQIERRIAELKSRLEGDSKKGVQERRQRICIIFHPLEINVLLLTPAQA
ncbi:hypothetical protein BDK51DRAFT_31857, partial [Blyttiomyces helicus]